jgi:TP53 regulating kinase-like protein
MDKISQQSPFKKGAEAWLYLADWHGKRVVFKKRFPKKYRAAELDRRLRVYRTAHEAQLINEAKKAGVPTPAIYLVDAQEGLLVMEFIEGVQVKKILNFQKSQRQELCYTIGKFIGKLHKNGIVHGDLTTSNMIQNPEGKIFFIDFGLGEKTVDLEAKGVDLHLMKRALQSAHFKFAKECFDTVVNGYSSVLEGDMVKNVLDKIREIEKRGRYIIERKGGME